MNYLNYSIQSQFIEDDNQTYYWAEFTFEDAAKEQYTADSPHYTRHGDDFHCLRVGALEAHYKLQAGEPWEDVRKNFRQSW